MNEKKPIPRPPTVNSNIPDPPPKKIDKEVVIHKENVYLTNGEYLPLPSAIDLEEVVIGAILVDQRGMPEIADILIPEVFYSKQNEIIFKAMQDLYKDNNPIDLLTVVEQLRKDKKLSHAGGEYYLIQATQKVSSSAHIEFHSRIILQKYIQRELIKNARFVEKQAHDHNADVFHLIDNIETNIIRILNIAAKKRPGQVNHEPEEELKDKITRNRKGLTAGVFSGIEEFDEWSGGFLYRELITIASRPGMGKTTAMLSMASRAVFEKDVMATVFSLEMSNTDLIYRIAARLTTIPYSKIRKGELTDEEFEKVLAAIETIKNSKLKIFDTAYHKNILERIVSEMRKLVEEGCKIVFLDYVQLIKLSRSTSDRTSDLSTITRELKALANELNVPIVIFAQLNRDVDKRPGHRPNLSDLKQSGSIEEDSDTVIFLLREAYYQTKDNPTRELPKNIIGALEFIVAKGRNIGVRSFNTFIDFDNYILSSKSDEIDF